MDVTVQKTDTRLCLRSWTYMSKDGIYEEKKTIPNVHSVFIGKLLHTRKTRQFFRHSCMPVQTPHTHTLIILMTWIRVRCVHWVYHTRDDGVYNYAIHTLMWQTKIRFAHTKPACACSEKTVGQVSNWQCMKLHFVQRCASNVWARAAAQSVELIVNRTSYVKSFVYTAHTNENAQHAQRSVLIFKATAEAARHQYVCVCVPFAFTVS